MRIGMHCFRWLITPLVLLCFTYLWATARAAAAPSPNLLTGQIQVLADPSTVATVDQIISRRAEFADLSTTAPNYGFTKSAYWLRIPVQNPQPEAATFYLDIKNPLLDYVTLYVTNADGIQATNQSGAQVAGRQRPYRAPTLVLPFHLAASEAAIIYVRLYSYGALYVPFALMDQLELQQAVTSSAILSSSILSICGAMLIYNLLLFSLLRSRLYLYYVLYLFFAIIGLASMTGFGVTYLYPDNVWLGSSGTFVSTGISLALMIFFAREFLATYNHRWLDLWARLFIVLAFLLSFGTFLWPVRFSYLVGTMMAILYPAFCFVAGVIALRRGSTAMRFFIIGQISSWIGLLLIGLQSTGLLPYHPLLYQGPALGGVADALLLSLALGDRIRLLQRSQLAAEEQARRNLEIRSDELERLVAARTAEIKTLQGILPICANCKKIRTDDGAWQGLEAYISQHTDAQFSHGICTDCVQALYPELYRRRQSGLSS